MNEEFNELLEKNSIPIKKPQQVVDHRWFSYYRTSLDIIELWSYLCDFINTYKFSSRKSNLLNMNRIYETFYELLIIL